MNFAILFESLNQFVYNIIMYRAIIRSQQRFGSSFRGPFHFHQSPFIGSPKRQQLNQGSLRINNLQGYLHLFRNPQIEANLVKTEVLLIIDLSELQHQQLIQYLKNRAQQIQVLDNIYHPIKHQSQPSVMSLVAVIVVFKSLGISQEAHQFIQNNMQAFTLYIQDAILMYGWNKKQLQDKISEQQLQPLKKALDGKLQQFATKQMSDYVNQKILQSKCDKKIERFSLNWVQLPHCIYCIQSLQYSVVGIKIGKKLTEKLKLSINQHCKACQIIERSKKGDIQCSSCKQVEDNWVCLVCGEIGCGRYKNADAYKHFTKSGHILSMDLRTRSIWNYRLDCFSHRMVNNGQINIKFPQCEEDVTETALEGAFWDYCSIVSEQLHRQRSFYEDTIEKYKKRYEDQNDELDQIIEELSSHRIQKVQKMKRQSKKRKKMQKKVVQLRQRCLQERQMNTNYQEVIADKQSELLNDEDIRKKKLQIIAIQQQIQETLLKLTQG